MSEHLSDLRTITAEAIRKAVADMNTAYGDDKLHGFALCTDDDVMTLFPAACTRSWVAERSDDYEEIGSIYTEWLQDSGDAHFEQVSQMVSEMADEDDSEAGCNRRFESFVLALEDCRTEGLFEQETLLCCGSTDPSGEMEMLAMRAVERLNTAENADLFAEHLDYEEYRDESSG